MSANRRIGLLGWRRKRSSAARNAPPWLWIKRADIKTIFCSKLTTLLSIRPSNLRRARVLAHCATRHPITFASITPPIAELRHTPSLQWQRYGRRYVPLLSSHKSSRGRFVGGAPWSNSLKRYCRVAIVNIHCCSPQSLHGCHAAVQPASVRGPFSRPWPLLSCSKKSLASFLAAPTDRHGRSPTARGSEDSLATSRRPNSRLSQILHSCGSNGDGRLKFQTAAGREWRCRAGQKPLAAGESDQAP